jgi:two-component system, response regulator
MTKKHKSILLIEDNDNDAELTMIALKKIDLHNQVIHLKDGAEAVDFFEQEKYRDQLELTRIKCVFLDLKLPKLSGFQVLEKLRGNSILNSLPIIVLSSSGVESDIQRAYDLGANSYIIKPINFTEHSKAIRDAALYWTEVNKTID